jgi:hypothetical protein
MRTVENAFTSQMIIFLGLKNLVKCGKRDSETSVLRSNCDTIVLSALAFEATRHAGKILDDAQHLPQRKPLGPHDCKLHLTRKIGEIFNGRASISIDERRSIRNEFYIENDNEDEALRLVKSYLLLDPNAPATQAYGDWILSGSPTS